MRLVGSIVIVIVSVFIISSTPYASLHYTVKSGDSLIRISKKLGIKTKEIKKLNPHINWLKIKPGDKISIPAPKPMKIIYTVKAGDSLRKIAQQFNITLNELKKLNPQIKWPIIKPNDKIIILKKQNYLSKNKQNYTYTIQKHDSLSSIAKKFHVSIDDVKRLNPNIDWSNITPKNKIKIAKPTPKQKNNRCYIVQKGDTLNAISRKFGVTLKDIKKLNKGIKDYIKPGDTIILPKLLAQKIVKKEKNNIVKKYTAQKHMLVYSNAYVVQKGDNLLKIAKKFNTTVETLKMINNINSSLIRIGETIFVPNQNTADKIKMDLRYTLVKQERDALIHYAEKFLGRPYKFGGTSLYHGIDCSAFVKKIYEKFNIKMPRTAQAQYEKVGIFVPADRLKKGDLLFFHTLSYSKVTHVGIYIGDDLFIHAAGTNKGIRISKLDKYYKKTLVGAKRVLGIDNRYAYIGNRPG